MAAITGAGSGIGRSAAVLFASVGAHVFVLDVDQAAAESTVEEITADGGAADYLFLDVTSPDSAVEVAAAIAHSVGKVDVLYNNAGGSSAADAPVHQLDLAEFWRSIEVDLAGTVNVSRAILPGMIDRRSGVIINTASTVALTGIANRTAYTAAKGGILALTRAMAVDYAAYGIRVNAVAPGVTTTPRVEKLLVDGLGSEEMERRHLLGYGRPQDVAQAALYLASPASARVTGIALPVDSGWSCA